MRATSRVDILSWGPETAFAVDPRPLRPDTSVTAVNEATRLPVGSPESRALITELERLRIPLGDASVPRGHCTSAMLPRPNTGVDAAHTRTAR